MSRNAVSKEFVLTNTYGMHVRPASLFVQTAMKFQADIHVWNLASSSEADGKSVMGMLMLAAPKGTRLKVSADGDDAAAAMTALEDLIQRGFDEE